MRRSLIAMILPFSSLLGSCDDAPGAPDDLEQACRQLLGCESDAPITRARLDDCRQNLDDEYEEAASIGCADAYADRVACYSLVPLVCSMQGPGSCEDQLAELERCRAEPAK